MLITSFKRIIRAGFYGFWRNGFVSLASVLIMLVTLSVITGIILMSAVFNTTLLSIQEKVDINVYFTPEASEQEVLDLKASLEALPEVAQVVYVSSEETLPEFKERHKDDQVILQALEELDENPLGAKFNIRAKETSQYQGVASFLEDRKTTVDGEPLIDEINFFQNKQAIDKLSKIITSTERFGFILALALVIVSVLITFNTIRLAIYVSREEIGVMRLVGASVSYIRGPFVFTGVMYGLMAGFFTLVIFYPITYWLGDLTENFFININIFSYYVAHFGEMFLIVIGSGIVIGAVSSYLAVMRYLRS